MSRLETSPLSAAWDYVLDQPTRILVADDDPILCEFANVYLATPMASVATVSDGEAAWSRLAAEPFDIALIDIEMPVLDGFGLVERLRADPRLAQLPVIMVTGREDAVSIDKAYRVGATSFVTKPVNWRQLAHQIRYVIRAAAAEREALMARDRAFDMARAKSDLMAMIRHELRTPLNAILGFSRLIETEASGPLGTAAYRDHARMIGEAGNGLMRMIADMMAFSDLAAGADALIEDEIVLARLIQDAIAVAGLDTTVVSIELGAFADQELTCDREHMKRALAHLIRNAERHGGGVVAIGAGRDGADLVLTVADRGPGIPPERLAVCLALFGQGDGSLTRPVSGLGLGLPLAARIAQCHGGRLDIVQEAGRGLRAGLRVPAERLATFPRHEAAA